MAPRRSRKPTGRPAAVAITSQEPPVPIPTAELGVARNRLKALEKARRDLILPQLHKMMPPGPHIETPRAQLLEVMDLAHRVYSHPDLEELTIQTPGTEATSVPGDAQASASTKTLDEGLEMTSGIEAFSMIRDPATAFDNVLFLGRIISRLVRNKYISFAVEDCYGRAELVRIAFWLINHITTGHELDICFPLGQMFIIKEPVLIGGYEGFVGFAVQSPTDFVPITGDRLPDNAVWTTPHPGVVPSIQQDWLALGNAAFQAADLHAVIKYYETGLDHTTGIVDTGIVQAHQSLLRTSQIALHTRLAQAQLLLKRARSCMEHAVVATLLMRDMEDPLWHELQGAIYSRARSAKYMHDYKTLLEDYHKLVKYGGNSKHGGAFKEFGRLGLIRVPKLQQQARTGTGYDWVALYREGLRLENDPSPQVAADWKGPMVVQRLTTRANRPGLVATRDIEPGELLLVEKALAEVNFPPEPADSATSNKRARDLLDEPMVNKLLDHTDLRDKVYALDPDKRNRAPLEVPQHFHPDAEVKTQRPGSYCLDIGRVRSATAHH